MASEYQRSFQKIFYLSVLFSYSLSFLSFWTLFLSCTEQYAISFVLFSHADPAEILTFHSKQLIKVSPKVRQFPKINSSAIYKENFFTLLQFIYIFIFIYLHIITESLITMLIKDHYNTLGYQQANKCSLPYQRSKTINSQGRDFTKLGTLTSGN